MPVEKKPSGWTHVVTIALALVAVQLLQPVPYSEIERGLADDKVERVVIGDRQLIAYLKAARAGRRSCSIGLEGLARSAQPALSRDIAHHG